jgi:Zn-dependent protease
LTIHEYAHGWIALLRGDTTARDAGRLTMNPIAHLDPFGAIMLLLGPFGWAKPVPVDMRNFKYPLMDDAIVSFMGPFSNFLLALVFIATIYLFSPDFVIYGETTFYGVMVMAAYLNVFLFVFNLLPIPPLDGSFILYDLFPNSITHSIISLGRFGTLALLIFLFSPLWAYFEKFVSWFFNSMMTIVSTVL